METVSPPSDLPRIIIRGFPDHTTITDISNLLSSFNPSHMYFNNEKGIAFASIPKDKLNSCLGLNKSKWKGNILSIAKANESKFLSSKNKKISSNINNDDNNDDQNNENSEEENNIIHGKYIGPKASSNITLLQWIWNEAETEAKIHHARKTGWKLRKISTQPKKVGKRRIIFNEDEVWEKPQSLSEYYEKNISFITGEDISIPKLKQKQVYKLEDVWGSSDESEDDSNTFDFNNKIDDRFVLDNRFSEQKLFQQQREDERNLRMAEKKAFNQSKEDTEIVPEHEDISIQIQKERSNALDILTSMNLHNPKDTLTHFDKMDEDNKSEEIDDNQTLWGQSLIRYDPGNDSDSSLTESNNLNKERETESSEEESNTSTIKKVVVNTSWARSTLGGTTWSLFGNTIDNKEDQEDDMEDSDDSSSSLMEIENTIETYNKEDNNIAENYLPKNNITNSNHSVTFFKFMDEIIDKQDENDIFMRHDDIETIEKYWRETRRNIITDYKRKSKQALQKNKK